MTEDELAQAFAEYKRWQDVQFAARDAYREGVGADEIRALIPAHRENARRQIAELEQMFELGEDE